MNYIGSLRIKNPKTLQKWIDKGWHDEKIKKGFVFNCGCGRYKTEVCECIYCRKDKNKKLKEILINKN